MAQPLGIHNSAVLSELRKFVAPEIIYGLNARLLAGQYAQNVALNRCLLVSDPGVMKAGWTSEVEHALQEAGTDTVLCTKVSPNPRDFQVMDAAALYLEQHCDGLVAVGGGSVIDCAKGIAIIVTNGGNILSYEGVDMVKVPMPPLICIPTTGGTAADVSQFAIITDTQEKTKIAIISKAVVPDVALVDPVTLTTMDPYLTACTGMDVLSHAVEAYVSNASSPITDLHAIEAIRLVASWLLRTVEYPHDLSARSKIMLASLQAGLAFSNASLGAVHAMAHSLGGFKDLPHGECNSILLPHVIDYNFTALPDRFLRIAEVFGLAPPGEQPAIVRKQLINHLIEFRQNLGIRGALAARGVKEPDLGALSTKAFKDPCNATNPRPPTTGDLAAIYREAL
ncbi:MAG TPA: iron-containing alcohol dehydrogenase [Candidatus Hydrogenedentes bacterium]|nr:iron-containing alcohol dehydrogenase [Candidatus Hydrogenedentota bacterium]